MTDAEKVALFDYWCWLETVSAPEELSMTAPALVLASDGTTCWGDTFADALRVAWLHDRELYEDTRGAINLLTE